MTKLTAQEQGSGHWHPWSVCLNIRWQMFLSSYWIAQGTLLNVMWQPGWEGSLGRMDSCICMAESLHCSPEIITTMLISSIQYKIKKFKVWGKKKFCPGKPAQPVSTDAKSWALTPRLRRTVGSKAETHTVQSTALYKRLKQMAPESLGSPQAGLLTWISSWIWWQKRLEKNGDRSWFLLFPDLTRAVPLGWEKIAGYRSGSAVNKQ